MSRPTEADQLVQIANFDKQIAEMRLAQAIREKAQAEYQANWYENAPLSWLLRKTAFASDRAVITRLTRTAKHVPQFDQNKQVAFSKEITASDLQALSRSYQSSVSIRVVKPGKFASFAARTAWLAYRVVRKIAKAVLKPLFARKRGA